MSFLKAEWRKLAIANYSVTPELLHPYVPCGTELDLWNDTCYLSLVGFRFLNTRLLGIKIPRHINFEEVNLRFYVRRKWGSQWRRGVVFIKEIVPRRALTLVANTVYKEHYQTLPMRYRWSKSAEAREVQYEWNLKGMWQRFQLIADLQATEIPPGSEEEFITEHYWGYSRVSEHITNEYEVTHPKWEQYKVRSSKIEVDFGETYGSEFDELSRLEPVSVLLAEGSEITVESRQLLRV